MEQGSKVIWREAVTHRKAGKWVAEGERVLIGTILRVRKSRGGTTDYKIDVEGVTGHDPTGVKGSIWVKRQKLRRGIGWERSRSDQQHDRRQGSAQSRSVEVECKMRKPMARKRGNGTERYLSSEEVAAWAQENGYEVASKVKIQPPT